ncbi:hypothetical protein COX08_04140 [Candidatus Beckwithbacteria bacterium CG23_combo_of_CG06-09_8_20_14_all_34_8]|uniref:Glycosyl transferase family 1 n=1 Tax=Candidatus Beckwithbacteria bacterium CG23_combo_of_CG06-09_8_20_14_all_34_8 TaxID=1974497 RepID=A0A2H0B5C7_9BACT|nr:MAG: hypothetical protein COX08_04140 [Candidatus Beckwithbacteria bacterium CG23_combo_of_CG06-09_8_20_14_all_34_8]
MIIGIDISQIVYQTGVSRYTKDLVRNLLLADKENEYKLYAGVIRQLPQILNFLKQLKNDGAKFKSFIYPISPKLADKFWNQWRLLEIENLIGHIDVWHSSNWTQPPTKAKKITTIHDLTPVLFPNYHDQLVVENFKRNLQLIEKNIDMVTVDSRATKDDLVNNINIDRQKITVIYPGVDPIFCQKSKEGIDNVKKKYKLEKPYILSVGTKEPRKNIKRLIEAFVSLGRSDIELVLVGKRGWGEEVEVGKAKVKELGFVEDKDLPALYSGAILFAYPSLYEGFGFPVLEAMACGCPVITSNISSLPEVVGQTALLVYPKETKEIANAINTLLNDDKLRQKLVKNGLEQAKKFSWEKTANQMIKTYQDINNVN